jgi:hypothetical protein
MRSAPWLTLCLWVVIWQRSQRPNAGRRRCTAPAGGPGRSSGQDRRCARALCVPEAMALMGDTVSPQALLMMQGFCRKFYSSTISGLLFLFVHGLDGDARTTWHQQDNPTHC